MSIWIIVIKIRSRVARLTRATIVREIPNRGGDGAAVTTAARVKESEKTGTGAMHRREREKERRNWPDDLGRGVAVAVRQVSSCGLSQMSRLTLA